MSRAKVPLNIENTPLDLTSSFSCLCAAWMYVANRTNSEIGLWQMGAEILGGSSAIRIAIQLGITRTTFGKSFSSRNRALTRWAVLI
jgi:hypothetical protein